MNLDVFNTNQLDIFSPLDAHLAALLARGTPHMVPLLKDAWTETLVGSGASTQRVTGLSLASGATVNSSTLEQAYPVGLTAGGGTRSFCINWAKESRMGFNIEIASGVATANARLQLKHVATIGELGEKGIGITVANLTLTGRSYNTALGTTATLSTLTDSKAYSVEIRHYPLVPKIEFWVNRVLQQTQTTSAAIPQAQDTSGDDSVILSVQNGNTATTSSVIFSSFWIWIED